MGAPRHTVTLLTKSDCALCDHAKEVLERLAGEMPLCHELSAGTSTVRVSASAPEWTGGSYEARLSWPPGPLAPDRLGEVVQRMRQVPELTLVETTTSGPGSQVTPMRITLTGERFIASEPYAGANVDEVRVTGENTLTLYLPGDQIFATLELDDAGRLSTARLITPSHEILREFSYPGDPG